MLNPPWAARIALSPILYYLSALTLQSSVYYRIENHLASSVEDFTWTLPDGKTFPSGRQLSPSYPVPVMRDLSEAGTRDLKAKDWTTKQEIADGQRTAIALWQLVFADALRERANDARVAVIHAATALDVAAQAVLPDGTKFDMTVLRGEKQADTGIPDLSKTNACLYNDLSQLWYTRHGIVHRGECKLYIDNPQKPSARSRPLTLHDVERFLISVPKGVMYIESNAVSTSRLKQSGTRASHHGTAT